MRNEKFEIQGTKQYQNSNVRITKTFGILNFCHLNLFRISNFDIRISHALLLLCSCALMHFVAGCENANSKETTLVEQIGKLTEQKTQLQNQFKHANAENRELKKQMNVLAGLPEHVKAENLHRLQKIKIGGYTNLYDSDEDGKREKLIVYIQPIDQDGDKIKAGGAVDVQLWDLNSPQKNEALLGQWHVEPDELRKSWIAFLVINYRLTFDVADIIENPEEPLTVKVTFTDYLTGKVFKEQKVITPQSP